MSSVRAAAQVSGFSTGIRVLLFFFFFLLNRVTVENVCAVDCMWGEKIVSEVVGFFFCLLLMFSVVIAENG